jgi:hypothetical protein
MGLRSGSGRKQGLPPSKNVYRSKSAQSLAKSTLGQTPKCSLDSLEWGSGRQKVGSGEGVWPKSTMPSCFWNHI